MDTSKPDFDQRSQQVQGQVNVSGDVKGDINIILPSPTLQNLGRADFYQHVRLPTNFVARPELLVEIREELLHAETNIALTSNQLQTDAIFGMGGIGKTVMARALCDDAAIRQAFPHGILWATLGQTPDLFTRLREWIRKLGGAVPQVAPTLEELTNILAENLTGRRCLLIVDDVWAQAHLERFMVDAPDCQLLFTTRNAEIATDVRATIRSVPVMTMDQASELLVEWASDPVCTIPRLQQEKIVTRLGRLPLAIKLAGVQLRHRSPETWLASFDAQKLSTRRPEDPHDSLEATVALSLAELTAEERKLFVSLSIFKEDEATPRPAITKLWSAMAEYSEDDTTELLHYLANRALLQLNDTVNELATTFHDLIRDFMKAELGEAGRHLAHRAILTAYRQTQSEGAWSSVPDDGYIYGHLIYHLNACVAQDSTIRQEMFNLFVNHNWLHGRVSAADYRYDGYAADLEATWQRYQRQSPTAGDVETALERLSRTLRLALIRTSINALAANYAPSLVGYAVELEIWPVKRAISIFEQSPDPTHKAQLGCALLATNQLSAAESHHILQQSCYAAELITQPDIQFRSLLALYLYLPEDTRTSITDTLTSLSIQLQRAWTQTNSSNSWRYEALLSLIADNMAGINRIRLLQAAASTALEFDTDQIHRRILQVVTSYLNVEEQVAVWSSVLADVLAITNEARRANVLWKLLPYLYGQPQALTAALAIQNDWIHAHVLSELLPHLRGQLQDEVVTAALAAALAIQDEAIRASILSELLPHLRGQPQALTATLTAALAIQNDWIRAIALSKLIPHLSGQLQAEAVTAALAIQNEEIHANILRALILHLSGQSQAEAVTTALAIQDEGIRANVVRTLLPHLSGQPQAEAATAALTAALAIQHDWRRANVLRELLPRLSGQSQAEAATAVLTAALAIQDEGIRANVVRTLLPHLSGQLQAEAVTAALTAALAIQNEERRANALSELLPHLRGQPQAEAVTAALTAALAIQNDWRRMTILRDLLPHLSGQSPVEAVTAALTAALTIQDEKIRTTILRDLLLHLSSQPQALTAALTAALSIQDEEIRATFLRELLPHLSGQPQVEAATAALTTALAIQDDWQRANVLRDLLPHLSGQPQAEAVTAALTAALAIQNDWRRMTILRDLLPHLSGQSHAEAVSAALTTTLAIQDEERRANALRELLPHLSGQPQAEAVTAALTTAVTAALAIQDEERHAAAAPTRLLLLKELLSQLEHNPETQAFASMLDIALTKTDTSVLSYYHLLHATQDEWRRAELIKVTLPDLDKIFYPDVAQILPRIPDQLNRRYIANLMPTTPSRALIQQQIDTSVTIDDSPQQAKLYAAYANATHPPTRTSLLERLESKLAQSEKLADFDLMQTQLAFCRDPARYAELQSQAFTLATTITAHSARVQALLGLLQHVAPSEQPSLLSQLIDSAQAIADNAQRAKLLSQLDPDIDEAVRDQLLDMALHAVVALDDGMAKINQLTGLLPKLKENRRQFVVTQMLNTASRMEEVELRAQAFAAILPFMVGKTHTRVYQHALSAASCVIDPFTRLTVLTQLAAAEGKARHFSEAKALIKDLDHPKEQAQAALLLYPLASTLEQAMLVRLGLKAAFRVDNQIIRAKLLINYIPYVKNITPIHKQIYSALALLISDKAQHSTRGELLDYLAGDGMAWLGYLPSESFLIIADLVTEICEEWKWL